MGKMSGGDAALIGGTIISTLSQIGSANTASSLGSAQKRSMRHEASQLDQRAGQERASSQRGAEETRRQGDIMLSDALAAAAAGGAGTTSAGALDIMGDLEHDIEIRMQRILSEGEDQAVGLETQAQNRRTQGSLAQRIGNAKKRAGYLAAAGTAASGLSSYADKKSADITSALSAGAGSPGSTAGGGAKTAMDSSASQTLFSRYG